MGKRSHIAHDPSGLRVWPFIYLSFLEMQWSSSRKKKKPFTSNPVQTDYFPALKEPQIQKAAAFGEALAGMVDIIITGFFNFCRNSTV